ncbi:MAG: SDR family oxidoreductase [Chloroflexi bacterium]|nr:SDR family oxidoreductase [Chloroflexota bacterium]
MGRLTGRVALVTGGARGIGRATCLRLGAEGARVAVGYVSRPDAAEEVVGRIAAGGLNTGGEAFALEVDVSSRESVRRALREVRERYGQLDILVNCAGRTMGRPIFTEISDEDYDLLVRVNHYGVFVTCQEALPYLEERRGCIVNVSSASARQGLTRSNVVYASLKGAINTLTQALARQWADRGVRVNAVAPAAVETDMVRETNEDHLRITGTLPVDPTMLQPEDVGDVVAFLCTDDARHVSGEILYVTSGRK